METNGNKIAGGGAGGGVIAAIAIYVSGRLGYNLSADDASILVLAVTAVGAFVAHNGILGVGKLLLRGSTKPPQA